MADQFDILATTIQASAIFSEGTRIYMKNPWEERNMEKEEFYYIFR